MKNFKVIASILILTTGFVGAFLIIKNTGLIENSQKTAKNKLEESTAIRNPLKGAGDIFKNSLNQFLSSGDAVVQSDEKSVADNNVNLTEKFSQDIVKKIQEVNIGGLTQKDGKPALAMPDATKITDEIIQQSIVGFDIPKIFPKIGPDNLKFSQDISKESQLQYLKNLSAINKKLDQFNASYGNEDILNAIIEKQDVSLAKEAAGIYEEMIDGYYQTSVPINWAKYHQGAISYFYGAKSVYEDLVNFRNDPLKAYLVSESLPALQMASSVFREIMAQEIGKNNLVN